MLETIQEVFPLAFVIALAYILKKAKYIEKEQMSKTLTFLGFDVVMTALLFQVFSTAPLDGGDYIFPLVTVGFCVISLALMYILARTFGLKDKTVLLLVSTGLNAGMLYPFIELHYSDEVFAKFILLDFGGMIILFTLTLNTASFLSKGKIKFDLLEIVKNIFWSPAMIAMFLGISVNLLNLEVPEVVNNTMEFLSVCFGFLVGFIVGINFEFPSKWNIFGKVAVFYLLRIAFAAVFSIVVINFFDITTQAKEVVFLILAAPIAMISVVFAEKYDLDSTLASQYVTTSLFLCVVLLPFLVLFAETL